ncbi:MAG: FtsX-like permease family protein [Spirochaetia bacterium]|jgi:ABC-type lipoprotein release transport system permease subunit|nr:FtsX-like permease family protein [Spirochaetia bacterium]
MLFLLALRNVLRNLRRLAPMMLSLVLVFALLVIGNAVLNTTITALYSVYARNVSGDLTVSPKDKNNFTIFGSDQLLVGEYLVPPVLVDFSKLRSAIESLPEVRSTAGLISSAARVKVGGQNRNSTVFGVDFDSYTQLVPGLSLEAGAFPEPGEPGIVVQLQGWQNAEKLIGEKVLLSAGLGRSFTLREVTLTGVVSYPVRDQMLDTVVLVDSGTARALNGYLYNFDGDISISEEDQTVIESDFDSLFSGAGNVSEKGGQDEKSGIDPMALFSGTVSNSDTAPSEKLKVEPEAWNSLLVSLNDKDDIKKVRRHLAGAGYNEKSGYMVRDWSTSVGGSAQLAWFLQLLFNLGLLFVSFGAAIIATNALLLSVLERTGEIGSLRAMGATRVRISVMIFLETFLIVFGSALIGIFIGSLGTEWLNAKGIVIDNPYIKILFGGKPVRGEITLDSVTGHLAAAFLLSIVSMLYPLKRALGISPVEAMSE